MKIIIECECGNKVEINPETLGNVAYISNLLEENDFYYFGAEIETELQQDVVTDTNDVEAELKEIRIDCRKCNDYIILSF